MWELTAAMLIPNVQTQMGLSTAPVWLVTQEMELAVLVNIIISVCNKTVEKQLTECRLFSDIDECFPGDLSNEYMHLAHNCHDDANCSNTKGSFSCACRLGYSGNGVICEGKIGLTQTVTIIFSTYMTLTYPTTDS